MQRGKFTEKLSKLSLVILSLSNCPKEIQKAHREIIRAILIKNMEFPK